MEQLAGILLFLQAITPIDAFGAAPGYQWTLYTPKHASGPYKTHEACEARAKEIKLPKGYYCQLEDWSKVETPEHS